MRRPTGRTASRGREQRHRAQCFRHAGELPRHRGRRHGGGVAGALVRRARVVLIGRPTARRCWCATRKVRTCAADLIRLAVNSWKPVVVVAALGTAENRSRLDVEQLRVGSNDQVRPRGLNINIAWTINH